MNKQDYDSYEIEEPSDEERAESSSEDELDVLLNGTLQQKKKLLREYLTGESESSSADEFEKEMEEELSSTMKSMEGTWAPGGAAPGATGGTAPGGEAARASDAANPEMYDKIYFDSDSEEDDAAGSSNGRKRSQRTVLTNDELLYDPDEDDRDQAWADNKRKQWVFLWSISGLLPWPLSLPGLIKRIPLNHVETKQSDCFGSRCQAIGYQRRRPPGGRAASARSRGGCSSDAVLNCPACMTTLCLDCQRHEKYRTQYRAMFVMNCNVKKDEVLRYKTQPDPHKFRNRRKRKAPGTAPVLNQDQGLSQDQARRPEGLDSEEVYHPVQCSECSTEVAVYDKDEVYHFFNILASHC